MTEDATRSDPEAVRAWLAVLSLRPVINASATLTTLGGSLMPPPVVAAMTGAARHFVDLRELQVRVGRRVAELTENEAAYVTSGAAAGITLAVAACMTGTDPALVAAFPGPSGFPRTEVVIARSQRNGYDYAARVTGARLVEIDGSEAALEAALSERTAAVLWFAGTHHAVPGLAIDRVIAVARRRGVPVLVDAAAQIPPVSSLWTFTRDLGADIAIFSGGKGLRGPQSSGFVLGRADLIAAVALNASPNHAIGRPFKVGKEELLGCLAALEWSLAQDEPATLARYEAIVRGWIDGLAGIPGVTVERSFPSEAGQPHGRALVTLGDDARLDRDALVSALWAHDPPIAVWPVGDRAIALNPQTLEPGEEAIVLDAVRRLLTGWPVMRGWAR